MPCILSRRSFSEGGRLEGDARARHLDSMHYAYIIRSLTSPDQTYIGSTSDLKARIRDDNAGKSPHTSKFIPWEIQFYAAFPDK